jgi:hypothetical protein
MKHILTTLLLLAATGTFAQRGYTPYVTKDGVRIGTKWGTARDADGVRKPALLIGVENTNKETVRYSYQINFFYEGMLRETGNPEEVCLPGRSSRVGKINGVYFIPQKFTAEQLKSTDFNFTLEDVEVRQVASCSDVAE